MPTTRAPLLTPLPTSCAPLLTPHHPGRLCVCPARQIHRRRRRIRGAQPRTLATISPAAFTIAVPQSNFDILTGGFGYSAGVQFMSDNIWRGISLTALRPGALAYGELREGWFYLGGRKRLCRKSRSRKSNTKR